MTKRALLSLLVIAVITCARSESRANATAHDADAIDKTARSAYAEGQYAFCTAPDKPLMMRQQALCEAATDLANDEEVGGCEGLRTACNNLSRSTTSDRSFTKILADVLGPVAKLLVYVLVLGIVIIVAIPVARALARWRRSRKLVTPDAPPNRAALIDKEPARPDEVADAEAALRLADEHRRRGELDRALGLYLAASLAALDRRGAIRIARHRTNGEYVRACEEEASRPPLREIVREVDKVEFGGAAPTDDGVVRVASRATAIVRAAAIVVAVLGFAAVGCGGSRPGADPAGDELPIEVLRRNGFKVSALRTSLATMPIPADNESAPVVIVDAERVVLEEEAQAHMMRWVEAGGVLVLFGDVPRWPAELAAKSEHASTRDLVVKTRDPNGGLEDLDKSRRSRRHGVVEAEPQDLDADPDPDADPDLDSDHSDSDFDSDPFRVAIKIKPPVFGAPIEIKGARAARSHAFAWKESEAIGFLDDRTYAATKRVGRGVILGVANDDLFTNVGVLPRRNAAALVTLVRAASHHPMRRLPITAGGVQALGEVRVARAEDGIPPPANPFAALGAAGLGKGAWHALVAAVLLFLAYGVRHARPRAVDRTARRAFAEHVEATGAFYGRTRAHAHALGAYGRFMEMRLREIIPRGADPAAFLASRAGVSPERAAELYARATKAKAGDALRGDELKVIEELRQMMERAR